MNEINLKKGDKVMVREFEEDDWIEREFHHFHDGLIFTITPHCTSLYSSWDFWKLPDPPEPEKKEYYYNVNKDMQIGSSWNSLTDCKEQRNWRKIDILCVLHVTLEEGKLPTVEVLEP